MSRPPLYPRPGQGQVQTVLTHTIVASLTEQMDTLSPQGWAHLSPRFCGRHASPHSHPPCSNLERPCPSTSCQLPAILRAPLTPPPLKDPADSSLPTHSASNGMTGGCKGALPPSHPRALCQPQTVERGHPPGSTPNRAGGCENARWRNPHLVGRPTRAGRGALTAPTVSRPPLPSGSLYYQERSFELHLPDSGLCSFQFRDS